VKRLAEENQGNEEFEPLMNTDAHGLLTKQISKTYSFA
jgi:hypothetical protein